MGIDISVVSVSKLISGGGIISDIIVPIFKRMFLEKINNNNFNYY
jgi:hypothetical protein